ncbi:NF-kappa-B inhibitor epsilon-like isoform X1 [Oncorhynchus nerka]|uniref:NF-kappa-B inhibitor epsilon-like isoform X1 n=1 Tax=Oncorhynchus nerka TaxID=8023 RepID=UPI00113186FE|nr:NF-kappa-B inhibitor epsilon-like isoform X1 [Oncorhynchus nerka]
MASAEDANGKVNLLEDNRIDSGVESFQYFTKDDPYNNPVRDSTSESSEARDKCSSNTEERLDSAYGSSSLTVENFSEILIEGCNISESEDDSAKNTELEHKENLLTNITEDGDTLLHLAIIHEDEHFAHQLIQLFPKDVLDIQNNLYQVQKTQPHPLLFTPSTRTPLHLATYLNLSSVVRDLVESGASLELQDQEGNTPLHMACEQGWVECATEMIRNVSSSKLAPVLESQNWRGLTSLHLATVNRQHRLMKLLMKKGADLNIQEGTSGKTPLHMAVELHDIVSMTLLLNKGADVDVPMFNGCTPLHLAVGRQDAAIANLLCQSGADKMLRNIEDETALDLAGGNDDILALFPFDDIQIQGRSVVRVPF